MKKIWRAIKKVLFGSFEDDVREFQRQFPGKDMMSSYEEYGKREGFRK
jgi:hypothetical protein